jgi:REP element-mobilizing transposase RayT
MHQNIRSSPHAEPIAYFLTWTTYGSWLPGDERGWFDRSGNRHASNPLVRRLATHRMREEQVVLSQTQRKDVERCIARLTTTWGWHLHAVQCRTEHVHVVVTTSGQSHRTALKLYKMWCSRMLGSQQGLGAARPRVRWWTRGGSTRLVYDERGLENVVVYVRECQGLPRGEK